MIRIRYHNNVLMRPVYPLHYSHHQFLDWSNHSNFRLVKVELVSCMALACAIAEVLVAKRPGFIPVQSMWDYCKQSGTWTVFFPSTLVFPCQVLFCQYYTFSQLRGGCLRTWRKSLGHSSGRHTWFLRTLFPRVTRPAAQSTSTMGQRIIAETHLDHRQPRKLSLLLPTHTLHLRKKFTFKHWSSFSKTK